MKSVILIFDIGKTNKKVLLYDEAFRVIEEVETRFPEIVDEDEFPCENMTEVEDWVDAQIQHYTNLPGIRVQAINFTTYGATLVYLDKEGNRIDPVYNYLKPLFYPVKLQSCIEHPERG